MAKNLTEKLEEIESNIKKLNAVANKHTMGMEFLANKAVGQENGLAQLSKLITVLSDVLIKKGVFTDDEFMEGVRGLESRLDEGEFNSLVQQQVIIPAANVTQTSFVAVDQKVTAGDETKIHIPFQLLKLGEAGIPDGFRADLMGRVVGDVLVTPGQGDDLVHITIKEIYDLNPAASMAQEA